MTPEREAYLAKCGERERAIRASIACCKQELKIFERAKQTNDGGENWLKKKIKITKWTLVTYRHELNLLKGKSQLKIFNNGYRIGYNDALRKIAVETSVNSCTEGWD